MKSLNKLKNKKLELEIFDTTKEIIINKKRTLDNRLNEYHIQNLIQTTPEEYWRDFCLRCKKINLFKKVINDKKDLMLIIYTATVLPKEFIEKDIRAGLRVILKDGILLLDKHLLFQLYSLYITHYKLVIVDEDLLQQLKLLFTKFELGYPFRKETIKHIGGLLSIDPSSYLLSEFINSNKSPTSFLSQVLGSNYVLYETEFGILTLINFIKRSSIDIYKELIEDFYINTKGTLYNILFSQIIVKLDSTKLTFHEKNYLLDIAIKNIGSPRNKSLWDNYYLFNDYSDVTKKASLVLQKWSREKLAIQFFESMSFDKTRKDFWLSYIDVIDDLKIAITDKDLSLHNELLEITKKLPEMFIKANYGISAILMRYKDNLIVEFSKTSNALYFYHRQTEEYSYFYKDKIHLTDGLKNTSIGSFKNFNKTGTVRHIQGWTKSVSKIMREL